MRNGPTDFTRVLASRSPLPAPSTPFRTYSDKNIKSSPGEHAIEGGMSLYENHQPRYEYIRVLGQGREGIVLLYHDRMTGEKVVVKSWFRKGRNAMPDYLLAAFSGKGENGDNTRSNSDSARVVADWPTEVEATLIFSGLSIDNPAHTSNVNVTDDVDSALVGKEYGSKYGILPVVDYFIGVSSEDEGIIRSVGRAALMSKQRQRERLQWYMVMPAVGGTLEHHGPELQRSSRDKAAHLRPTISKLDSEYRPALHGVLVALNRLHSEGYCHDDVKPDNIFLGNDHAAQWLLGDLGNVRDAGHAYHATVDYTIRNHWSDCKSDDVRRLLKSYLSFLRDASVRDGNSVVFDYELYYVRNAPWARLYWAFTDGQFRVEDVLSYSQEDAPAAPVRGGESGIRMTDVGVLGIEEKEDDGDGDDDSSDSSDDEDHEYKPYGHPPLTSFQREMLRFTVAEELTCSTLKWQWAIWVYFYVRYGWLIVFPFW